MSKIEPTVRKKAMVDQDARSKSLYSDDPVIFPEDEIEGIVGDIEQEFQESEQWIRKNYEHEWIDNLADYQSIPSEMFLPWPGANQYFMPSINITVENYTARFMESIRGAREFISCRPRGRDDEDIANINELLLRYQFEELMEGYKACEDNFRMKAILGTNITTSPYHLEQQIKKIDGVYIWDKGDKSWVLESEDEQPDPSLRGPKDFSELTEDELGVILASNKSFQVRDLFQTATVKEGPSWINHDIFTVKPDPNGGNDINDHRFVIFESVESIDTIKRKVAQNIYDAKQAEFLIESLAEEEPAGDNRNDAERRRDAVENYDIQHEARSSVKIWTRYGRHKLPDVDLEEETISIVANGKYLLRCVRTPFEDEGIQYRPVYVDRFIELPYRFYGMGIASILKPLNRLLNHLVNQVLNHGDIYNSPPLIHPLDGQWKPDSVIMGPGQTIASDNSDGFKILQTPDIKSSQIEMINFVSSFIDRALGIHDFTQSTSGALNTAHGLANVLREVNRRLDFYAKKSHEGAFKKLFTNMLKMNKKFMDSSTVMKITDKGEWEEVWIENKDVSSDLDIKIFADSVTASREFDQQKWGVLAQSAAQTIDPATGQPKYDNVKVMDQLFKSYGEIYPELYHTQQTTVEEETQGESAGQVEGQLPAPPDQPETTVEAGGLGDLDPNVT